MKGKMKKIIAGIATLAMASQFAFVIPASAAVEGSFFSTDFGTAKRNEEKKTENNKEVTYYTYEGSDLPTSDDYTWGDFYRIGDNNALNSSAISFDGAAAAIGTSATNETKDNFTVVTFTNAIGGATEDLGISFKIAKRYNGEINSEMVSFNDEDGKTLFGVKYRLDVRNSDAYPRNVMLVSNDKEILLTNYSDSAWIDCDMYVSFASGNGYVTVNGVTLPYDGTAVKSISLIKTGNTQNRGMVLDDLKIDKKTTANKYLVNYVIAEEGYEKSTYTVVDANGHPTGAPETEIPGITFLGWTDGTTTSKDLNDFTITKVTTLTAKYGDDPDYIEPIKSVEIIGPDSMTFGPDPDTAEEDANHYTLKITGEKDTVITASTKDARISDFKITWDIDGFKTENDTADQYCDSYGAMYDTDSDNPILKSVDSAYTNMNFKLRNIPRNFYGTMKATVTYKSNEGEGYYVNQTLTAKKIVIALGNSTADANTILPTAGYPSDFNEYDDSLVDYEINHDNNGKNIDLITGEWLTQGSGGSAWIKSDDGNKYLRFSGTSKASNAMGHKIDTPNRQAIFEQDVRFSAANSVFRLTSGNTYDGGSSSFKIAASVGFDGSHITTGGTGDTFTTNAVNIKAAGAETDATIEKNKWYHLVISFDPTTKTYYTQVYDITSGELLAESGNVAWIVSDAVPTWYGIAVGKNQNASVDINNYSAYYAAADMSKYTLTASGEATLSTAKKDETLDLEASLKTAKGYEMTGKATWSVVESDMEDSIRFTVDPTDSHKVNVALTDDAVPGTATIQVNIGGYVKTLPIEINSSSASVKFTKSTSSISIPLDETKEETAEFEANVVDGEGAKIGDTTFAVYDKSNANPYTLPEGIEFDTETGVLKVHSNAKAVTFSIRATGSDGENTISRAVKVNVHGLAFDFGNGTDADLVEGYTAVTPTSAYTEKNGYGIVGSVSAGGTASTDDATKDYLEGAMTFTADVQNGKVYQVDITYQGILSAEPVNTDMTGYELGSNTAMTESRYTVPVVDNKLDLVVASNGDKAARIAAITITKLDDKTPDDKPNIRHVGDSTSANNGSWAYRLAASSSDEKYAGLFSKANFYNNGAGGRNLCSYYNQGKLASVLRELKPGDIMMFGNNGTNGMGNTFEEDVNYYLNAAEAMGAYIIINSYTPDGGASYYNSSTKAFNGARTASYETITRKVAAEREANDPNYLGFVEIGQNADQIFTAYAADYAANGYDSADAAAAAIYSCFTDHNHYSNGTLACDLMLEGYTPTSGTHIAGAVEQIVDILNANPTLNITAENTDAFTVKVGDAVKANGAEIAQGETVTIEATGAGAVIKAINEPFVISGGKATYTAKLGDKTIPVSEVAIGTPTTISITAENAADFDVKVGGEVKESGAVVSAGDVVTIEAKDATKEIKSVTPDTFTVSRGKATYTVKADDTTIAITAVEIVQKPKLTYTAAADFKVKLNGTEVATDTVIKSGDRITIEAAEAGKEITAVTAEPAFTINEADGTASYTVKATDTVVAITSVTVEATPEFAVTFPNQANISGAIVSITAAVTGRGTKTYDAYVAEYDGTALKSVKKQAITITNTNKTAQITLAAAPSGTVKMFIWDQANNEPVLTNTAVNAVAVD